MELTSPEEKRLNEIAEVQKQAWIRAEKALFRKYAMEEACQIIRRNGGDVVKEAQKIYDWLVKELDEKTPPKKTG